MLTDAQITAQAWDATKHHSNPVFTGITNPNFRKELMNEVLLATEGRGNNTPFAHKVAELVAARQVEREAAEKAENEPPVVNETVSQPAPNVPAHDEWGNPLPTPLQPGQVAFQDLAPSEVQAPEVPNASHSEDILAQEQRRIAEEETAKDAKA